MDSGLHQDEIRQFERLLHQQKLDRVADRMAVVKAFLAEEGHHTAGGWHRLLARQGVDLEPEFVSETLDLLTRLGLAMRRSFEGEEPRYEHRHLGEHHDHLICTGCGAIREFHHPELELLKAKAASQEGFLPLRHRLQIYGLCAKCQSARQPTMPLALASPGEKVRIQSIQGGGKAARHLADLGLTVGSEVEVISANGGPMVVAVRGSRVALGRGVAHKVMVSSPQAG